MTPGREKAVKIALLLFVLGFVLFFSRPQGQFRMVALGDTVPDFTLRDDEGEPVTLSEFRGKVVVLNFWASWCAPCVEEIPSLNRFVENYADRDVEVVGVSLDEDPRAYTRFVEEHQVNFLTLRNSSHSVAELYGTYKLPETYIINREGVLVHKVIGPTDWSSQQMYSFVDSLLASTQLTSGS